MTLRPTLGSVLFAMTAISVRTWIVIGGSRRGTLIGQDDYIAIVDTFQRTEREIIAISDTANPTKLLESCSFAGGGFRTITYCTAVIKLKATGRIDSTTRFYGASLGALFSVVASLMVCPHDSVEARDIAFRIMCDTAAYISNVNVSWYGMWGELHDVCYNSLRSIDPKFLDCFQGRCNMSITRLTPFPRNEIINQFDSIDDLARQCAISMFVPFFTKIAPFTWYKGHIVIDGAFTDNTAKPPVTRRHLTIYDPEPPFICVFVPPRRLGRRPAESIHSDIIDIIMSEFNRSHSLWDRKFASHDNWYASNELLNESLV